MHMNLSNEKEDVATAGNAVIGEQLTTVMHYQAKLTAMVNYLSQQGIRNNPQNITIYTTKGGTVDRNDKYDIVFYRNDNNLRADNVNMYNRGTVNYPQYQTKPGDMTDVSKRTDVNTDDHYIMAIAEAARFNYVRDMMFNELTIDEYQPELTEGKASNAPLWNYKLNDAGSAFLENKYDRVKRLGVRAAQANNNDNLTYIITNQTNIHISDELNTLTSNNVLGRNGIPGVNPDNDGKKVRWAIRYTPDNYSDTHR